MAMLSAALCLCLLATANAAPSPKRQGIDVDKTVAQVEEVLRHNSNLPRLSRDDILQLLNDIRAEDERSASASSERTTPPSISNESTIESEEKERERIELNEISDEADVPHKDLLPDASSPPQVANRPPQVANRPTPKPESLMVVLPYTPRDGSTLQELYTRPPRVALLRSPSPMRLTYAQSLGIRGETKEERTVSKTVQPLIKNNSVQAIVVSDEPKNTSTSDFPPVASENETNADIVESKDNINANKAPVQIQYAEYPDIASDIREFLQVHGLHGNTGSLDDHFLLPLDGFKPLPPMREIDGSVELPEKILLTYDLVSPPAEDIFTGPGRPEIDSFDLPPETVEYEPLRPELSLDLNDLSTLSSDTQKVVVPLDSPSRKRKAVEIEIKPDTPKYSPIEYDAVKVIPLAPGPDLFESDLPADEIDVQKRQSENSTTTEPPSAENASTETSKDSESTTVGSSEKSDTPTTASPSADSAGATSGDSGPSIADLESSFGAPAPADESEAELPPPRKNGFYWMVDWNSFLEVGDGDEKVNIRFEPKLGDPQMFLPVTVP